MSTPSTFPSQIKMLTPSWNGSKDWGNRISFAQEYFANRWGANIQVENDGFYQQTNGYFDVLPVKARIAELRDFMNDPNTPVAMCNIGGGNSGDLLDALASMPKDMRKKVFGYSENTLLVNAGTYHGHFQGVYGPSLLSEFGSEPEEYTADALERYLTATDTVTYEPPSEISAARQDWTMEVPDRREMQSAEDWQLLGAKKIQGTVWGGEIPTFVRLLGTNARPRLSSGDVLILESSALPDDMFDLDRLLWSLVHAEFLRDDMNGIIFGRWFEPDPKKRETINEYCEQVVKAKHPNIPLAFGVDFGHTEPTFPITIGKPINLTVDRAIITI